MLTLERKMEVVAELVPQGENNLDVSERVDVTPFSIEELETSLKKLRNQRSAGPDGIPPKAVKEVGKAAAQGMLEMLNSLLETQTGKRVIKKSKTGFNT